MPQKAAIIVARHHFIAHLARNTIMGLVLIAIALGIGMLGYHSLEHTTWVDAFLAASMILSGMGPTNPIVTFWGKVFAGCYALFSGLFFILIMGLIFAPLANRYFQKWHLELSK